MAYRRPISAKKLVISISLCMLAASSVAPAIAAATVTACTAINLCYGINSINANAIAANISRVWQEIAAQRAKGKAIGYLSIPLSTTGGSYFGVNLEVAQQTKDGIEKRLRSDSVWILNPGSEGNLPAGASGADDMYMWTQILEGTHGLGEDFDFFYFAGSSDFAQFFQLTGVSDLDVIASYFDKKIISDATLKKAVDQGSVTRSSFRDYYGLRASVAFSLGSHDEWNIARLINKRRRGSNNLGISSQISIFFDDHAVPPASFGGITAPGDAGRCIN